MSLNADSAAGRPASGPGARPLGQNPAMEVLRCDASLAERIGPRPYEVTLTSSIALAEGQGEAHAYVLYFGAGGEIGPHEAGFGQLLFAVSGDGWVAGADGERVSLPEGHVAFIRRGEVHAKGSDTGLTALMIQVRDLNAPIASTVET
jgi:quercetin dioxygenase-like cupin family protein